MAEEMGELLTPEEIHQLMKEFAIEVWGYLPEYAEGVASGGMTNNKWLSERVAKAQLAKLLNASPEGGTDAISWGKGLQDGIQRERERIQVWGPEPCPHFDGYEKRECSLCWEDLFKGES